MRIKLILLSFFLVACGDGSSADGTGDLLGRCGFALDANNIPRVVVTVTTEDKAIRSRLQSDCELARVEMAKATACITTTPNMYPAVLHTKKKGYTVVDETTSLDASVSNSSIKSAGLPDALASAVVFQWMFANKISSFAGCQ